MASNKNKYVAGALAFFLGHFGIHWFYLRRVVRGTVYCGITLSFIALVLILMLKLPPQGVPLSSTPQSANNATILDIIYYIAFLINSFAFIIIRILALIDAIRLFAMNKKKFNDTFNEYEYE